MKKFLTKNQQLLLALFFANPEKPLYMNEVGRIVGKKPGVFQRTLNALVEEGLLTSRYQAHARFFQANIKHPLYSELKSVISKTAGVEGTLKNVVAHIKGIKIAILYGSYAKNAQRKESDVDLLVVGKPSVENELLKEISILEKRIQREINYKLYSEREYRNKRLKNDPFLEEVLDDQKIILKGNPYAV